jgi:hypothetical protein
VGKNPIGDYLRYIWKKSEESAPDEAKRLQDLYRNLKPIERYYYNCIVRREEDENGVIQENVGPKILSVGKTLHEKILTGICGDPEIGEEPLGDVTDHKVGRDFKIVKKIVKSGDQSYPKYEGSKFLDSSPLGTPEQIEKWTKDMHDLSALRIIKPVEVLEHELKCHLGLVTDSETEFNASEYENKVEPVTVENVVSPMSVPLVKQESVENESDDESPDLNADSDVDPDFLAELNALD